MGWPARERERRGEEREREQGRRGAGVRAATATTILVAPVERQVRLLWLPILVIVLIFPALYKPCIGL